MSLPHASRQRPRRRGNNHRQQPMVHLEVVLAFLVLWMDSFGCAVNGTTTSPSHPPTQLPTPSSTLAPSLIPTNVSASSDPPSFLPTTVSTSMPSLLTNDSSTPTLHPTFLSNYIVQTKQEQSMVMTLQGLEGPLTALQQQKWEVITSNEIQQYWEDHTLPNNGTIVISNVITNLTNQVVQPTNSTISLEYNQRIHYSVWIADVPSVTVDELFLLPILDNRVTRVYQAALKFDFNATTMIDVLALHIGGTSPSSSPAPSSSSDRPLVKSVQDQNLIMTVHGITKILSTNQQQSFQDITSRQIVTYFETRSDNTTFQISNVITILNEQYLVKDDSIALEYNQQIQYDVIASELGNITPNALFVNPILRKKQELANYEMELTKGLNLKHAIQITQLRLINVTMNNIPPSDLSSPLPSQTTSRLSTRAVIGLSTGLVGFVVVLVAVLLYLWDKREEQNLDKRRQMKPHDLPTEQVL